MSDNKNDFGDNRLKYSNGNKYNLSTRENILIHSTENIELVNTK